MNKTKVFYFNGKTYTGPTAQANINNAVRRYLKETILPYEKSFSEDEWIDVRGETKKYLWGVNTQLDQIEKIKPFPKKLRTEFVNTCYQQVTEYINSFIIERKERKRKEQYERKRKEFYTQATHNQLGNQLVKLGLLKK